MAQPMIDPRILELDASHRYPSFQSPRPDGTSEARARWVRAINTVIKQRVEPSPRSKLRSAVEQITLGIRQRRERENDSDDDQGSSKRRKLNLWKCKNCRDARKKCLPVDRIWPQKCDRCLQHRPELECTEPQLNTRKRGQGKTSKPGPRSKPQAQAQFQPRSTIERSEPRSIESGSESEASAGDLSVYERPTRTAVFKGIKKEVDATKPPEISFASSRRRKFEYTPLYIDIVGDRVYPRIQIHPRVQTQGSESPGCFRILCLAPGRRDDKIVCWFEKATFSKLPKYEAIAYAWEGSPPLHEIELRPSQTQSSAPFFIRQNLYGALRSLRHPSEVTSFWVDAICINQDDVRERAEQVMIMRDIYHMAKNVCLWLGEDSTTKTGLNFIPDILDFTKVDSLSRDVLWLDLWLAFLDLLKNPVFSRLWVVQEIAVAKNVTVHCGQHAIHCADLVDAVAIFTSLRNNLSTLFARNQKNPRELYNRRIARTESFIEVTANALRKRVTGEVYQRQFSLEELVSMLSDLHCADARDAIYSLLPLAKDGPNLFQTMPLSEASKEAELRAAGDLSINYLKSVEDVYQSFVLQVIGNSRSLDIICRPWARTTAFRTKDKVPSWIRTTQLEHPGDSSDRIDADSLVGLPRSKFYHASGHRLAALTMVEFLEGEQTGNMALSVQGFRLDSIGELGPRASEGIILREWFELAGSSVSGDIETVPDEFWRTLVGDRSPEGSRAPSWYNRALMYCIAQSASTGDINTNQLIAECDSSASLVVSFLRRVQSVIWNRKLFVSKENGWIGLAPMAARVRDVICILYGCSVPVLLRPYQRVDHEQAWQVIGECYVHGMMDGEAMERTKVDSQEDFELI